MLRNRSLRITLTLFILFVCLGATTPANAADDWMLAEVEAIRGKIDGIITELSYNATLDASEVADLRAELSTVYRDLDRLADRIARERPLPGSDRPGGWATYQDVSVRSDPPGAVYRGWQPQVKMSLEWGNYGEVEIAVIKNGYSSNCRIFNAYAGGVNASLESRSNGDIIVYIDDDLGGHEFLIENGGLGPVFIRGRDSGAEDASAYSLPETPSSDEWFAAYRALVDKRQIDASPEMEWFISQYTLSEYDPPALSLLGERLAILEPDIYYDRLGWMVYESGGYRQEIDIPDPRTHPLQFMDILEMLYTRSLGDLFWELHIPRS